MCKLKQTKNIGKKIENYDERKPLNYRVPIMTWDRQIYNVSGLTNKLIIDTRIEIVFTLSKMIWISKKDQKMSCLTFWHAALRDYIASRISC